MSLRKFLIVSGAWQIVLAGLFSVFDKTPGVALVIAGLFLTVGHLLPENTPPQPPEGNQ